MAERAFSFEDNVTARLMDLLVSTVFAEDFDKVTATEIARKLHPDANTSSLTK